MFLNLLKRWKDGAIGGLALAVIFLLLQVVQLRKARLVYENPATTTATAESTTAAPSVIVTRTWKTRKPADARAATPTNTANWKAEEVSEATERTEWIGARTETKTSAWSKTPVSVSTILGGRNNRWLLTVGGTRASGNFDGKYGMLGYSWGNRFDLRAGAMRIDSATRPMVDGTIRF